MSDNWLQYVPKDPAYRPSPAAAEKALSLLSSFLPEAESVDSTFQDGVTFFHPGANWSGVQCPACGADAESWWGEALEQAAESELTNLQCVAVCCGAAVSLNDLKYLWPSAFGSYVLQAMNPDSKGLLPSQLAQLQAVLGCQLVEVPVHL